MSAESRTPRSPKGWILLISYSGSNLTIRNSWTAV